MRSQLDKKMELFLLDIAQNKHLQKDYTPPLEHEFFKHPEWKKFLKECYVIDHFIYYTFAIHSKLRLTKVLMELFKDFIMPHIGGRKKKTYIGKSYVSFNKSPIHYHIVREFKS